MIPRLKDGTQLADAQRRLRETATHGRNLVGSSAGQSVPIHQNSFLAWVGSAESQLRNIFIDPSTWERLYGDRHWQIYGLTQESPRAIELINNEATFQAAWLEELADRLKQLSDRWWRLQVILRCSTPTSSFTSSRPTKWTGLPSSVHPRFD